MALPDAAPLVRRFFPKDSPQLLLEIFPSQPDTGEGYHWINFECFEVVGLESGGHRVGDLLFSGHVKWDGCAEIEMDAHTCSPGQFQALLDAAAEAHRIIQDEFNVPHPWVVKP